MTAMATTILMPKLERETGDPRKGEPNVHRSCSPRGPGNGFRTRKTTHPRGATSGGLNPSSGFWTRKTTHPQGENPGSEIRATDFGLGKPVNHVDNFEDTETQVMFRD